MWEHAVISLQALQKNLKESSVRALKTPNHETGISVKHQFKRNGHNHGSRGPVCAAVVLGGRQLTAADVTPSSYMSSHQLAGLGFCSH